MDELPLLPATGLRRAMRQVAGTSLRPRAGPCLAICVYFRASGILSRNSRYAFSLSSSRTVGLGG